MKKLGIILLFVLSMSIFTGCTMKKVAGEDLIQKARSEYISLESGKVVVWNEEKDREEQVFIFKYKPDNVLTYSYMWQNGVDKHFEYNNGEMLHTEEKGEITEIKEGDEDFVVFSRKNIHPNVSIGMIFFTRKAIIDATMTETAEGKTVVHEYDVKSFKTQTTDEGTLKSFVVTFYFDKEDKLINFTEKSVLDTGEDEITRTYLIEISEKNSIKELKTTP